MWRISNQEIVLQWDPLLPTRGIMCPKMQRWMGLHSILLPISAHNYLWSKQSLYSYFQFQCFKWMTFLFQTQHHNTLAKCIGCEEQIMLELLLLDFSINSLLTEVYKLRSAPFFQVCPGRNFYVWKNILCVDFSRQHVHFGFRNTSSKKGCLYASTVWALSWLCGPLFSAVVRVRSVFRSWRARWSHCLKNHHQSCRLCLDFKSVNTPYRNLGFATRHSS